MRVLNLGIAGRNLANGAAEHAGHDASARPSRIPNAIIRLQRLRDTPADGAHQRRRLRRLRQRQHRSPPTTGRTRSTTPREGARRETDDAAAAGDRISAA